MLTASKPLADGRVNDGRGRSERELLRRWGAADGDGRPRFPMARSAARTARRERAHCGGGVGIEASARTAPSKCMSPAKAMVTAWPLPSRSSRAGGGERSRSSWWTPRPAGRCRRSSPARSSRLVGRRRSRRPGRMPPATRARRAWRRRLARGGGSARWRGEPAIGPRASATPTDEDRPVGRSSCWAAGLRLLDLDLDVDTGRQIEPLQRVDRLGRRIEDVEQALVDAHLEMLA